MNWVHEAQDIPTEEHYVILENSAYIDCYDETKQRKKIDYITFNSREQWEAEIKRRATSPSHTKWVAAIVRPAKVEVKVSVEIDLA